jgi:hypothetical protein
MGRDQMVESPRCGLHFAVLSLTMVCPKGTSNPLYVVSLWVNENVGEAGIGEGPEWSFQALRQDSMDGKEKQ